ncbi:MAG: hypothetical protein MJE77_12095 [Proteobacteria bacterium]|nr:hypothetical protein [Pseudomonadota bacterium]
MYLEPLAGAAWMIVGGPGAQVWRSRRACFCSRSASVASRAARRCSRDATALSRLARDACAQRPSSPHRQRWPILALAYRRPVPWYRKWWVWATIGGVLAASTGAAVYALSQEPPNTVGGRLDLD